MTAILKKIKNIPSPIKSAFVYVFSVIFSKGLVFLTIPIFTRLMTTAEIGTVSMYNTWFILISSIATLSLTSGGFSVALKEFKEERDQYVSSILSLTSIIAIILAIVYFINTQFWNNIIGLPTHIIILMLFGFLFSPARDFWLARNRYEYKYKLSGFITIFSSLFSSILSIIVVMYLTKNMSNKVVEGRLFSNFIIVYLIDAIIWIYIFKKGKKTFSKRYWALSLQLSLPLVGYQIASQILNVSDRLMIDSMIGKNAVGVYSTLYSISSLSLLIWNAINTSFIPYLFQNIDKENSKIKDIASLLLYIYALFALMITLLAPEIVSILGGAEYMEAIYIMPPIAAGIFLTSVAHMYSNILVYYKKTSYVMYAASIAAVVNIILNFIFIPKFGYIAAAYTTLASYVLLAFFESFYSKKIGKKDIYDNSKILKMVIIAVCSTTSCLFFYNYVIIRYILLGVVAIIGTRSIIKNIDLAKNLKMKIK